MANIAKLRDKARAHELRDQWREALDLYTRILDEGEGEEVDIAIWNRIGDLHLRLNETEKAVEAYEKAVNAYVDVGLYNNAIALCRKILRVVPGRALTYRRLGQISAAKGFLADARQNFLEFAERMRRAGRLDESFAALKEFADLSPSDTDIRRQLADQLLHHRRTDEAVEQLRILLGVLDPEDEVALESVRHQIIAIDPTASTEPLVRARAAQSDEFGQALDTGVLGGEHGFEIGATIDPGGGGGAELAGEIAPLEGLELTSAADEPTEERADDLPLLDFDPGDAGEAGPGGFGDIALEPTAWQGGGEEEDADGGDLPMLDMEFGSVELGGPPAAGPAARSPASRRDRVAELRERVRQAPEDAAARDELIAALHESGLGHEEPEILEEAHLALAASGRYRDAILPVSDLIRLRPGDGPLLQKRVEYAFRSGDREALAGAYLSLARHFDAEGERNKAHAVYRRVLEMDPTNAEARAAMVAIGTPAPPPPRQAAPPPSAPAQPEPGEAAKALGEYIDLGELILEGERGEGTTRFVVEEKEPTGDEERDFADMLAHFRKKVAENIEIEDASSHYDLGLAFKEMGLLDEAIAEFQVALRGGANPLATLELLGQCFVEKGQYPVAARVLGRALAVQGASDAEMVGVLYQLARAQEAMGEAQQAIEYYERVLSVDIRFRDTSRRIEALRAGSGAA